VVGEVRARLRRRLRLVPGLQQDAAARRVAVLVAPVDRAGLRARQRRGAAERLQVAGEGAAERRAVRRRSCLNTAA
jgi:hypothetical protein